MLPAGIDANSAGYVLPMPPEATTDSRTVPLLGKNSRQHSISIISAYSPSGDSGHSDGSGRCDDEQAHVARPALLRLPELVDVLAKEGRVLRWDGENTWYEVLDGAGFEERFNALRCTREKRKEQAADRPFAR